MLRRHLACAGQTRQLPWRYQKPRRSVVALCQIAKVPTYEAREDTIAAVVTGKPFLYPFTPTYRSRGILRNGESGSGYCPHFWI